MSRMKRFAEQVSVEMGYAGELTLDVLEEAQRRLEDSAEPVASDKRFYPELDETQSHTLAEEP